MTEFEAVVIGTGFGGAIAACRLAKRWPGGAVALFERGKRYPMGSFPRTPHDFSLNFWNVPQEHRTAPGRPSEEMHGLFDVRNYHGMDAVLCAGYGGGSLIYANVYMEPPEQVFDSRWPETVTKDSLTRYYAIVKEALGARPIPVNGDPRRRIVRTELFGKVAREMGKRSELVDINVFFGRQPTDLLDIGHQEKNRYGALQTSCVYCGECDVGCNTHSKNTLDLNYLHVAERRYGARVFTEHLVRKIVPLDRDGRDAPDADGTSGYRVYFDALQPDSLHADSARTGTSRTASPRAGSHRTGGVTAKRVIVSAGTLGTTELLLQCRDRYRTLPRISPRLGERFSGNGDFLSFAIDGDRAANPNYGPVITQRIDFGLFTDAKPGRSFIMEDASYPTFSAWFVEGARPGFLRLGAIWRALRHLRSRVLGWTTGSVGVAFRELLSGDLSQNSAVILCMGLDHSNGVMSLDSHGELAVSWPVKSNRPLYDRIVQACGAFSKRIGARSLSLPTWWWPCRQNVTVHALGGCALAMDAQTGVTSADPATFGQVFAYTNLFVCDGALLPTSVGANPTATISAIAERVAEGITGITPDANL